MITAVDSNVLIDLFGADPKFGPASREALRAATAVGVLVACDVVWAEVAGIFTTPAEAARAMATLGVAFSPLPERAAIAAGMAWKAYRARGGKRDRMLADFLVGTHALEGADRLLSRDRGYYRSYFPTLQLVEPSNPQS